MPPTPAAPSGIVAKAGTDERVIPTSVRADGSCVQRSYAACAKSARCARALRPRRTANGSAHRACASRAHRRRRRVAQASAGPRPCKGRSGVRQGQGAMHSGRLRKNRHRRSPSGAARRGLSDLRQRVPSLCLQRLPSVCRTSRPGLPRRRPQSLRLAHLPSLPSRSLASRNLARRHRPMPIQSTLWKPPCLHYLFDTGILSC